ncbi:hypothetical protein TanjilG_01863 [Lupinus angustifolius]|uniref:poly(A)-specific ribonuclease n=1 Tax=Lupinus angustifolius TaxID=3871 RepID=A0A1J7HVB8_LUPAN|nr:PREDICTED: probable CCR4-associated factor 1 homolog 9 [Lupinus angustifolius]OIW16624.1 hypothetical protein TanjilG_01863 [Lupinus angustifolius]
MRLLMNPPRQGSVVIRRVWRSNVEAEFHLIRNIITSYPVIAMDTEFPGLVIRSESNFRHRKPSENYALLKANVDRLHLIQVGLTLSDKHGNLPNLGTPYSFIWEFNFCDFDVSRDLHAPESIALLRRQGIDFEMNRKFGIHLMHFRQLLLRSRILGRRNQVSWVTFHSAYDFGFLVKILTRRPLPEELAGFLHTVRIFFGEMVFDVKHVMKFCSNLYGGLDRICQTLRVDRVAGNSHQAGSDSLLTLHAFHKIKQLYFGTKNSDELINFAGVLYDLEENY